MPKATLITSDHKKGRQATDLFRAAYDSMKLEDDQAQCLNERGGEFQDGIRELITTLSVSGQFADEEVRSSYDYPSGHKPKGIVEQTNRLRDLWSGVGYVNQDLLTRIEKGEVKLPEGAEGWFAVPNWIKHPQIFGSTYGEAVQAVNGPRRADRTQEWATESRDRPRAQRQPTSCPLLQAPPH